jgi:cytochrome c556
MTRLLSASVLALALAVAACGGQSAQDKAQSKVCSARADIKKQVDALKSTTLTSASVDGVKANLTAIQKDVEQIANAQGKLSSDRKQEVQKANQAFKSQVTGVAQAVVAGLASGGSGQQQIKAAFQALGASYQSALAPIKCN